MELAWASWTERSSGWLGRQKQRGSKGARTESRCHHQLRAAVAPDSVSGPPAKLPVVTPKRSPGVGAASLACNPDSRVLPGPQGPLRVETHHPPGGTEQARMGSADADRRTPQDGRSPHPDEQRAGHDLKRRSAGVRALGASGCPVPHASLGGSREQAILRWWSGRSCCQLRGGRGLHRDSPMQYSPILDRKKSNRRVATMDLRQPRRSTRHAATWPRRGARAPLRGGSRDCASSCRDGSSINCTNVQRSRLETLVDPDQLAGREPLETPSSAFPESQTAPRRRRQEVPGPFCGVLANRVRLVAIDDTFLAGTLVTRDEGHNRLGLRWRRSPSMRPPGSSVSGPLTSPRSRSRSDRSPPCAGC